MEESPSNELQTFVGRNSREVYAKVRQALGRDAVIIEQVREGTLVRVIASRDFPENAGIARRPAAAYLARLSALGFEEGFIDGLPAGIQNWQQLENLVLNRIPLSPSDSLQTGVLRFVGAPGAGKTTTIIKLMAERVLHHGSVGNVLISSDTQRLAGCEQLALAAELLAVKYIETTPELLESELSALGARQLVLIDTAGISFGKPNAQVGACDDVLVVPATWQANALRRLWMQLDKQRLKSLVISHIDQAESLGVCLSVASEWGLPLRWLSRGPELYDDLEPANSKTLAQLILLGIDRSEMNATFA